MAYICEEDPRHLVDINAVLLEAINIPETMVEGSRQQEAENFSLAQNFEAISSEEDDGVKTRTSTRASRETLTSQSSSPSPQHINLSFNNTGSGVMVNRNIGNFYKTTITNVGNNNSVNHYRT